MAKQEQEQVTRKPAQRAARRRRDLEQADDDPRDGEDWRPPWYTGRKQ
jgi:hypothetical protein